MKLWRKPLDADQWEAPRGKVYIIDERCKGCGFCIEFCPRNVLAESERYNTKGYHPPEVVEPEECVHCSLCELICPDFAIFVLDAKEVEAKKAKKKGGKKGKAKKVGKKKKTGKGPVKKEGKK